MRRCRTLTCSLLLVSLTALPFYSHGMDEGRARKLVNSQGCKACHSLEGDGGKLASSFTEMRTKLNRDAVRGQLINPARKHGYGAMPDFSHLDEADIDALVEFIQPQQ